MNIEQEIEKIIERNRRVEADKAWELSLSRKLVITIGTYVVAFLFMYIAELDRAWLAAFVPVLAYLLSTITVPSLKKRWAKKYLNKQK